jgi:hypothetical protein
MTLRTIVGPLAALLVLTTALAQDDADPPPQVDITGGPPPSEEACFFVRNIRSFSSFDDRHIYLEGRRSEHFLLTMYPGCIGLSGAIDIALSNELNRVCSIDSATVTYRALGQLQTCNVRQVEAVEDRDAAKALAEFRKRAAE